MLPVVRDFINGMIDKRVGIAQCGAKAANAMALRTGRRMIRRFSLAGRSMLIQLPVVELLAEAREKELRPFPYQ